MSAREFPTLDVVTVVTGVMVSDRGIDAVYDVCGHVLGDTLWTHQLPAASRACEPALVAQHPWLRDLDPPSGDLDALLAWCDALVGEHGPALTVAPAEDTTWVPGNALRDLVDLAGGRPVVAVVTTTEETR